MAVANRKLYGSVISAGSNAPTQGSTRVKTYRQLPDGYPPHVAEAFARLGDHYDDICAELFDDDPVLGTDPRLPDELDADTFEFQGPVDIRAAG